MLQSINYQNMQETVRHRFFHTVKFVEIVLLQLVSEDLKFISLGEAAQAEESVRRMPSKTFKTDKIRSPWEKVAAPNGWDSLSPKLPYERRKDKTDKIILN